MLSDEELRSLPAEERARLARHLNALAASSHADLAMSIASAAIVELPLAALLLSVSHRLLHVAAHRARALAGDGDGDEELPLRKLPIFGVPAQPR